MQTGIYIGANKDSVDAARLAIMDILEAATGDKVKISALKTLSNLCNVNDTSIMNCHIDGSENHTHMEKGGKK